MGLGAGDLSGTGLAAHLKVRELRVGVVVRDVRPQQVVELGSDVRGHIVQGADVHRPFDEGRGRRGAGLVRDGAHDGDLVAGVQHGLTLADAGPAPVDGVGVLEGERGVGALDAVDIDGRVEAELFGRGGQLFVGQLRGRDGGEGGVAGLVQRLAERDSAVDAVTLDLAAPDDRVGAVAGEGLVHDVVDVLEGRGRRDDLERGTRCVPALEEPVHVDGVPALL